MTLLESRIIEAREYARQLHAGQMYGDEDYFWHLQDVACRLRHAFLSPCDTDTICAGWLHDAIEDTKQRSPEEEHACIRARFGEGIANIVWACTGEGSSRQLRNAAIRAKLIHNPQAARVKLADRVCNVEACWQNSDGRLFMYKNEHSIFRTTLLAADVRLNDEPLFRRLDALLGQA